VATITVAFGHAGSHVIIATYSGNANFGGSISAALTEVVNPIAATTTTLISSLNPSLVGQAVTFTATVASTTLGTPAGIVTFTNNGTPMGSATLNASGVATITVAFGHAGSHVIIATYTGNASFTGSSAKLTQTVNPAVTTTVLASSVSPSLVGQSVTFTATVTDTTTATPSGTVNFTNNGVVMGSATLNGSGVATFTVAFGHTGSHLIIATYAGTADFGGSTSAALTQTVNPIPTTTTVLTSSVSPSQVGQSVTFTATVTATSGTPTGSVTFTNNGQPMGSATLNASGVATITVAFGHAGSHVIVATYAGNAGFIGSNATLTQTVNPAVTTTVVASSVNPSSVGQSVTFTATVTDTTTATPSGTVNFTNNGVVMGSATLNGSGVATITVAFGHAGSHVIIAMYAGTADFGSSTSVTFTQVVN
jgi:Big-like domain-containing protein